MLQLLANANIQDISFARDIGIVVNESQKIWFTFNRGTNGIFPNDAGPSKARLAPNQALNCPDQYSLVYNLYNYGTDTLRNVYTAISIGTSGQTDTVYWSGALAPGDSVTNLALGSYYFAISDSNKVKLTTLLPNGIIDETLNNSITTQPFPILKLSGTYSVGGPGADFATLATAFDILYYRSNCGHVVFEVNPGNYSSALVLRGTPNTGPNATITVRSATGNAADVILGDSLYYSTLNVLTLSNITYTRFENITFKTYRSTPNVLFNCLIGIANVAVSGCVFNVVNPTANTFYAFRAKNNNQPTVLDKLSITNCKFYNVGSLLQISDSLLFNNNEFSNSPITIEDVALINMDGNKFINSSNISITDNQGIIYHTRNQHLASNLKIDEFADGNTDTVFVINNLLPL